MLDLQRMDFPRASVIFNAVSFKRTNANPVPYPNLALVRESMGSPVARGASEVIRSESGMLACAARTQRIVGLQVVRIVYLSNMK